MASSLSRKRNGDADDEWSEKSAQAVERLTELNINFVAIDFDQTLIDIHTGGAWKGSASELAERVRPLFRHFIPTAMSAGIHVAIVTFSRQVTIVREVLDLTLAEEQSSKIPIRGADKSWSYFGQGSKEGKQAHIASAVEELEALHGAEITRQTTLLIDDDGRNVRTALLNGVRAIWLDPRKSHRLLNDIISMLR